MKEKEREKNETEKNKRSEKNEIKGVEKKSSNGGIEPATS